MTWRLIVAKRAQKQLAKLPKHEQKRIEQAFDELEADPFSGDIKRLQSPAWRRRVGDYRIFYDLHIDRRLIAVTAIKRRTSTTY